MATYFQVTLTIQSKNGGMAELVLPKALQGILFDFIIVKEGGSEGIIRVEAAEATIKKIESDSQCKKLTNKQVDSIRKSYPVPKLKQKFRLRNPADVDPGKPDGLYELDAKGNKIIDTVQTVRSGFYLIDVPVTGANN